MFRRTLGVLAALALLFTLGACRDEGEQPAEQPERTEEQAAPATAPSEAAAPMQRGERPRMRMHRQGRGMGPGMGVCAMEVPDTEVTTSETDDGVVLAFRTSQGNEAKIREVVQAMSERHQRRFGAGMQGRGGRAMMGRGMRMVPSTATYEEADEGARLILTPRDPQDLESLRQHMTWHVDRMRSGECPMWKMYGEGDAQEQGAE